jgi:tRNA-binding protein
LDATILCGDFILIPSLFKGENMPTISMEEFEQVELRAGTILSADDFPEARIPAYIIKADFGEDVGVLKCSARITVLYRKEDLPGKRILGVVNFPARQIGPIRSEFLLTGFYRKDGEVVLAVPDMDVPNGSRLA